jgi:hypothetical protein
VAHLDLGHRALPAGPFERRQEHEADLLAARRLVCIEALAEALAWTRDAAELAAELGVDQATLGSRLRGLTVDERACLQRGVANLAEAA